MKRMLLVIMSLLILTGCSNENKEVEIDDKYYKQYQKYEEKLNEAKDFETEITDFSIRLVVNETDQNEYRYDVIIDSPNVNMYYLQAIAKVENDENSSLPTLGVLEENNFSLVPNVIDKEKGIYKGVNLSGITNKSEFNVYVYLTYYLSENDTKKVERYIMLYGNAA